jgi:hypothetical protein
MEGFKLKKFNEVEGKKQYSVQVSIRLTALKDFDAEVEINSAWKRLERKARKCNQQ